MRSWLLNIRVTASVDSLYAMTCMLKVGSCNQYGIDIRAPIQLFIIAHRRDGIPADFLDVGSALFTTATPNIGDRNKFEVHLFCMLREGRNQSALHPIPTAYDPNLHLIVGAGNSSIALCAPRYGRCCECGPTQFQKLPAIIVLKCHYHSFVLLFSIG